MLHLHFLKGTLDKTTNWAVLQECGHELLQFYWFRSAVKLFNNMLNTNSDTLRRVFQAALNLQPRSSACWTAILLSAFQGLRGCELYVRAVQTGCAIPMQEYTEDLKHRMINILPTPSSLWAEETFFLSVYTFFRGLFSSPTLFAATGQQPTCSWFPFSAEH